MRNPLNTSHFWYGMAFALAFGMTWVLSQPASAHEWGPRFKFYITNPRVENRASGYSASVTSAVNDYRTNTNRLRPTLVTAPPSVIIYVQGRYGETGWDAGTVPYYQGSRCVTWPGLSPYYTGPCATNHLFDFAYIYFNDSCPTPQHCSMPGFMARHELGHAFGLGHVSEIDCPSTWSIMLGGFCRPNVPTTLQSHDKNDLNAKYP